MLRDLAPLRPSLAVVGLWVGSIFRDFHLKQLRNQIPDITFKSHKFFIFVTFPSVTEMKIIENNFP
jgi:hypothetical protein